MRKARSTERELELAREALARTVNRPAELESNLPGAKVSTGDPRKMVLDANDALIAASGALDEAQSNLDS